MGISLILFFIGLLLFVVDEKSSKECTDYTLNQYEAGDVPIECINLFIGEK